MKIYVASIGYNDKKVKIKSFEVTKKEKTYVRIGKGWPKVFFKSDKDIKFGLTEEEPCMHPKMAF
jgi:hypothetical protein